jgi:hypothetical protein
VQNLCQDQKIGEHRVSVSLLRINRNAGCIGLPLFFSANDVLAKILAEHDLVDGLWYHGSAEVSRQVEALSVGNLKRTCVNGACARD